MTMIITGTTMTAITGTMTTAITGTMTTAITGTMTTAITGTATMAITRTTMTITVSTSGEAMEGTTGLEVVTMIIPGVEMGPTMVPGGVMEGPEAMILGFES
jgi:hypothetical protein